MNSFIRPIWFTQHPGIRPVARGGGGQGGQGGQLTPTLDLRAPLKKPKLRINLLYKCPYLGYYTL